MPNTLLRTRRAEERDLWPARGQLIVRPLALLVVSVAIVVLAGWVTDTETLTRVYPEGQHMRFNAALSLGALGVALLVRPVWLVRALVLMPLVLGLLTLVEYAADVDLGIDQLLVTDDIEPVLGLPGRMAESTSVGLAFLACAVLALTWRRHRTAQLLTLPALVIGLLSIYGYAYGADSLESLGGRGVIAPHTAISLVLLSVAVLFAVPRGTLQWIAFGQDPGAALQRLLIPVALVLLPLGGYVRVRFTTENPDDVPMSVALMIVFVAAILIGVGLVAGRTARRIDAEREHLLDELTTVNRGLEDRVRARSLQLNRQRTKLALLEERDRIARDLHDRVIQRIFAAGLQVSGIGRTARKEAAAAGADTAPMSDSLDAVATELDLAIRELRHSIFELTSIADHDDVEQVVRDIAARASRILGFSPRIEVSGPVGGLSAEMVAHLASVLQEALSNVARHARAGAVEISVCADDREIELRVEDDGVGMPDPLPRTSGVANLTSRALALGGTASWEPRHPQGTILRWRVPRGAPVPVDELPTVLDQGYDTSVAASESDHNAAASSGS